MTQPTHDIVSDLIHNFFSSQTVMYMLEKSCILNVELNKHNSQQQQQKTNKSIFNLLY